MAGEAEKKKLARHFRKNMPLPEILLWNRLKRDQLGFQFRRQDTVGPYILDFYCPSLRVDVEIDGKDHLFRKAYDEKRDEFLNSQGIQILRIEARSVLKDPDYVAGNIKEYLLNLQRTTNEATSSDGEVGEERTG